MSEEMYSLANLKPDDVEEIKNMEHRLSEKVGSHISLIAYQAETAASGKSD